MANNSQIDEVSLGIRVEDKNSAAKINAVADAINKLQKSLASLKNVSDQMKNIQNIFNSLGSIKVKNTNDSGKLAGKGEGILKKIDVNEQQLSPASTESATVAMADYKVEVKATATTLKDYLRTQNQVNDSQKEGEKKTSGLSSAFSKFTKSIGRVAFYRMIRTALKEIVQAAREGIENIRQVSPELNKSLNNITMSFNSIKNSFASLLVPIIELVQPLITKLADSIARIVNKLNEARAVLKGETKYSKILTSDTKEYTEQLEKASKERGKLLSFDTFTVQQARDNQYTGMKSEDVTMTTSEAEKALSVFGDFKGVLDSIIEGLGTVWEVVKNLIELIKPLLPIIIKNFKTIIEKTKAAFEVISAILKILTGDFEGAWKSIAKGFAHMVNAIANMFIGLVNLLIDVLNLWLKPISLLVELLGGGKVEIPHWEAQVNWTPYARGGNYNTGDYFVANENGNTELVASSNSGGGSVMNLDQWASISYSSFYRALSDYDAAQNGHGGGLDINSLGRTIAGNSGFVNEMNRRNASLNLI